MGGLAPVAIDAVPSAKAIEASKKATLPKAFWAWDEIIEMNKAGYWPSTPQHQPALCAVRVLRHAA